MAMVPAQSIVSVPRDLVNAAEGRMSGWMRVHAPHFHRILRPCPQKSHAELNAEPVTQPTLPPGSMCAAENLALPGR